MTAKELLAKVKAVFAEEPAAPAAPVTNDVPTSVDVTLADGKVMTCTPAQEVGADCMIDGAPAPDGEHALPDGSAIVCEGGKIKEIKPAAPAEPAPVEATVPPAVPVQAAEVPKTADEFNAIIAAFAVGTPEERLANLELVSKALVEYSFGWQIREAQDKANRDAAIAVYQTKLETAEKKIEKQDEVIKGLFELAEKLAEQPTAEPRTLNTSKKEVFERTEKRERRIESIASAIKEIKNK